MNPALWVLTLVGSHIITSHVYNEFEKAVVTEKAYKYAKSKGKPVLDFGCGVRAKGDYNIDITEREASNFIKIERFEKPHLPFPNKFFGSALCFHVLEHTKDPGHTMKELSRVAEKVFIITPQPFWLSTWLHGGHKWIFIDGIRFRNPFYRTREELDDNPLLYPE